MNTISDIISTELSRRLIHYKNQVDAAPPDLRTTVRDELNNRYLCLQMAQWIVDHNNTRRPAITKTDIEVRVELKQWQRDIQRAATVKSAAVDGRTVALIQEVIDTLQPMLIQPEQILMDFNR